MKGFLVLVLVMLLAVACVSVQAWPERAGLGLL